MKKQLFIFSLEPLESRYTKQWFTHLPKVFGEKLPEFEIIQLNGTTTSGKPTEGAFLDFAATNLWKNEQMNLFFQRLGAGQIDDNAVILFTDAWNPTILEVKYTKDLLKKNWKLVSIWHAGSYIDEDPLGQLIQDKRWSLAAERSFYEACDVNLFASVDHIRRFVHVMPGINVKKAHRTGFPMEYISEIELPKVPKKNQILFGARLSPEKQPDIFDALSVLLPEYEFVAPLRDPNPTKEKYHLALAESKVAVWFSTLETLGIGQHEALHAGAIPLVPSRLCYPEQYPINSPFIYPGEWAQNLATSNLPALAKKIKDLVENHESYHEEMASAYHFQRENFFGCDIMCNIIRGL